MVQPAVFVSQLFRDEMEYKNHCLESTRINIAQLLSTSVFGNRNLDLSSRLTGEGGGSNSTDDDANPKSQSLSPIT